MAWTRIDESNRGIAHYVNDGDYCYYLMDKIDGGYNVSDANQKLFNFKKPMERKGLSDWNHKETAIGQFADDLSDFLKTIPVIGTASAVIPMPTSKREDDPMFDDRLIKVVEMACSRNGVFNAVPFSVKKSVRSSHTGGTRDKSIIENNLLFHKDTLPDNLQIIVLVDDVISTGAHFAACRDITKNAFSKALVIGVFWSKLQKSLLY